MAAVFVVEDEVQVLILAELLLEEAGYETVSASTVPEAMAILQSDQKIDLLFTDLQLRDEADGGLILAQAAVKSRPGLPVLYTTARGLTDGMTALFVEPFGFIAKPYTPDQLTTAVANLLA
jgi:DNA-binding NtrC family response regulator